MQLRNLTKPVLGIIGLLVAFTGAIWLWIASSGNMRTAPAAGYLIGGAFLVVATPLLMYPFKRQLAKRLAILLLFCLAGALMWLAFAPGQSVALPALIQVSAIALPLLLAARVGLAWHQRRKGAVV